MNTYSAIMFINEVQATDSEQHNRRQGTERVKSFIFDYCIFYLSKNLPVILRQDQKRMLRLDIDNLFAIVSESLHYIVDARADQEIILQFASTVWADKDVAKFLT